MLTTSIYYYMKVTLPEIWKEGQSLTILIVKIDFMSV